MLSDKLTGPKVRILLSKFLPVIFMDAMRDSPEASVHMFEGMWYTITYIHWPILVRPMYTYDDICPPTLTEEGSIYCT